MAFREKMAWLTLVTILIAYGVYFGLVGPAADFGRNRLIDVIWSFGAVALAHAAAVIVGSIAIAVTSTKEARAPADERDRAIARRGSTFGYYVLLAGMIHVGVVMPFSEPSWRIVNTALLAIVVAEVARDVVILLSYRRGWHA
ncbi:MAG TPA: hypothetical protein VGB79_05725 [Allosphingosinicella sp.]|jgi:uncharacterized BrkB/YihY/UPF0761 family membrane protein